MNEFFSRIFRKYFITSSLGLIVTLIIQVLDSVIAGRLLGESAISAVNLIAPIYGVIMFVAVVISTGMTVMFTKAVGEFDKERMTRLFSMGLILSLVVSIPAFVLPMLLIRGYLGSYDVGVEVSSLAMEYFKGCLFVYLITPLYRYAFEMVDAVGDITIVNAATFANILVKILSSVLLCRRFGIFGISLGTLAGIMASILVYCLHFFRKSCIFRFRPGFYTEYIKDMLGFSLEDSSYYLYSGIAAMLVNKIIVNRFTDAVLPVLAVVICLLDVTAVVDIPGIVSQRQVFVLRGEKNTVGIKKIIRMGWRYAIVEGIIIALLLMASAPFIPQIFGITSGANVEACIVAVRIISIQVVFTAMIYCISDLYVAMDHIMLALFFSVSNHFIFRIVIIYILSGMLGLTGVWIAFVLSPLLCVVIAYVYSAVRYDRADAPFILEKYNNESYCKSLKITRDSVIGARNEIGEMLKSRKLPQSVVNTVMLLCEEVFMLIAEENPGKELMGEYTLIISDDEVSFITRDNGRIFDITDLDKNITSLRSMIVSSYMEYIHDRANLYTTSYNRNMFRLRLQSS